MVAMLPFVVTIVTNLSDLFGDDDEEEERDHVSQEQGAVF